MSTSLRQPRAEETLEDLDIINAALECDFGDEDDDDDEELTDRERGEKIVDILIPPCEWEAADDEEEREEEGEAVEGQAEEEVEGGERREGEGGGGGGGGGVRWIQRVSRAPPSRTAVIQLWEQLDLKIKEQQARTRGICAIRRALYRECFDELIRQVTLDCPERGLLLARVRDEANMTIEAFQCLFHSASEFGATKAIQSESGKGDLEDELEELEDRVAGLEAEVRRLEAWKRQVTRRWEERREVQMTLFTEELECLERSEKQYQVLIETLLASRSG